MLRRSMAEPTASAVPEHTCPECGDALRHVETVVGSGAFRTQAASMPQMPIHYYDCDGCGTCWKFATRLLPDPVRQIARDAGPR
jgi:predicted nucleic acid-binding Zn ribbon protein